MPALLKRTKAKSEYWKVWLKDFGKDILKNLEDIFLFKSDSDSVRISNILVIAYIAHKIRLEFLWQRFLNFLVPKCTLESIFFLISKMLISKMLLLLAFQYVHWGLWEIWHFSVSGWASTKLKFCNCITKNPRKQKFWNVQKLL